MNREILFRGKRLTVGEWVEGDYTRYSMVEGYITVDLIMQEIYQVDAKTIGQYTGLTDKNGKKIFEGDIILAHLDDLFPEEETILEVVWHDYGWHGKSEGGCFDTLDQKFVKQFSVIGNIHDNPELLESTADGADQDVLMPET